MPAVIWAATFGMVVMSDLLTGVLTGLGLSVLESIRQVRQLGFRMRQVNTETATELRLAGTATFIRLPQLLSAVESAPPDRDVRIRTRGLRHMDHTFASGLQQIGASRREGGRQVVVV
jgi:MFS superfamily sulfate permease-like transporter